MNRLVCRSPADATGATIAATAQQTAVYVSKRCRAALVIATPFTHPVRSRVRPFFSSLGLVFMFSRPHPAERVVGARAHINKNIVDHAHHVLIVAEGGMTFSLAVFTFFRPLATAPRKSP